MGRLVLEDNPYIDEKFYYNERGSLHELRLMRTLAERRFDAVIDFMANPRSALYAFASRAPRRIAFWSRRRFFYTETVARALESDYIVREKFRLLAALGGVTARSEELCLPWMEQHTSPLMEVLGREDAFRNARQRIVISPTNRRQGRRWPLQHYARLAERLAQLPETSVMWVWGPGEEELINEVMALTKVPTLKAPPTGFRELAALIANCDLFIGNSNGPSHIAVAVATPSLQIHGPTQARAWSPQTLTHRAIEAPHGDLLTLDPNKVWHEIEAMWDVVQKSADARRQHGVKIRWNHI